MSKAPPKVGGTPVTENLDLWTSALLAKSTAGRGSNGKIEAYGFRKLRELILELAVRGKLVPQRQSDEPVSTLLERLAEQKAACIDGRSKRKNRRPSSQDNKNGTPIEIPEGWQWQELGALAEIIRGVTYKKHDAHKDPKEDHVALLRANNIGSTLNFEDLLYIPRSLVGSEQFLMRGDLLLAMSSGSAQLVGKAAQFDANLQATFGAFCGVVRAVSDELWDYLGFFFRTPLYRMQTFAAGKGIGINNLTKGSLESLFVPIPPLEEQHRIVAKVDELMALCDQLEKQQTDGIAAHQTLVETLLGTLTSARDHSDFQEAWTHIAEHFDTLFTTEHSIDQLKQTILQLAVMGKLVPQDPNDEPASLLLQRISTEKQKLIEAKEIPKPRGLPEIDPAATPFGLPRGWRWAYVWDVAKLITSGSRDWAKYYSNTGAIFVTMGNLSRGDYRLRLDSLRYVNPPPDGEGSRTRLEASDLLVSITGDVGNLGLIPEGFGEAYINQHTCLIRLMPVCQNRYFPELMRSPWAKHQFDAPQRGVKNSFRLSDVGEMLIPVPPLAEQYRIVAKVDELMALCDALKARIKDAQTIQTHLADAIVEQAVA